MYKISTIFRAYPSLADMIFFLFLLFLLFLVPKLQFRSRPNVVQSVKPAVVLSLVTSSALISGMPNLPETAAAKELFLLVLFFLLLQGESEI